jgi:predicted dehydrogenase
VAACTTLSELLRSNLDYVVVAAPTRFHHALALQVAQSGTPALIEKPLARTLDEAEEIERVFREAGLICAVGHVERFNPALRGLKEKISQGVIGKALSITTSRVGPYPHRISDVGVIRDLATHDFDLVLWLSGQDYDSIECNISTIVHPDREDIFQALARLSDGTLVTHEVNWLTPYKRRQTSVLGELGMLEADSLRAELRLFKNGTVGSEWDMFSSLRGVSEGEELKFVVPVKEPLLLEHQSFQSLLQTDTPSDICTASEGLEVMRLIERISPSEI